MIAASALLAASALATPAVAQSSSPFSFGSQPRSSSSSAPGFWLLPTAVALGFGVALSNYRMLDVLTGERIYAGKNRYMDIILFWELAAISAPVVFVQLGFYNHNGDVKKVVQAGGAEFATSGDIKERGVFVGAGVKLNVDGSPVVEGDNKVKATGALSFGLGHQKFSAFGGGFAHQQDAPFVRAEMGLEIPVGASSNIVFNPGLIYTQYSGDDIDADNLVAALRFMWKF